MDFDQNYSLRMRQQNRMSHQYNGIALLSQKDRIQFYDEILKECKGKRCIDVGSGSGILAFLALKHGAKHVTCFEQNPKSSHHIRTVAEKMNVSKKITVINTEFKASNYYSYELNDIDILFHELVGGYIWDDMMGVAFDVPLPIKIIPSEYIIHFSIVKLTLEDYSYLINSENNPGISKGVTLNVGLSSQFTEYYNEVIQSSDHFYHYTHIMNKPININQVKFALDEIYNSHQFEHIGTHIFDANNSDHYQLNHTIQFKLPQIDQPYLIVVHPLLKSQNQVFDFKTHHIAFSGYYNPIIVPPQSSHKALRYKIFENRLNIDKLRLK